MRAVPLALAALLTLAAAPGPVAAQGQSQGQPQAQSQTQGQTRAEVYAAVVDRALDGHVLPRWRAMAQAADALSRTAAARCAGEADRAALEGAFHDAFDAWAGVSHLNFGPAEAGSRALAMAFWPDPRGFGPRTLGALLRDEDPIVDDPGGYAEVSVAARGLLALEWLLYDEAAPETGAGYPCRLTAAIAADLARTAGAVLADWEDEWAPAMRRAGAQGNALFPHPADAPRTLLTALLGGVEALADQRLGRPLGSWDKPRPRRAEARRSGRTLRNVQLNLASLQEFSGAFAPALSAEKRDTLEAAFARAATLADRAPAPVAEAVEDPQRRLALESLQTQLRTVRDLAARGIGPALGVTAGFNSQDGD